VKILKADNSVHDSRLLNEAHEETGWNNKKPGHGNVSQEQAEPQRTRPKARLSCALCLLKVLVVPPGEDRT
jgi:hypothetical protein